jgi:hypothetical protein
MGPNTGYTPFGSGRRLHNGRTRNRQLTLRLLPRFALFTAHVLLSCELSKYEKPKLSIETVNVNEGAYPKHSNLIAKFEPIL